MPTTRGDNLFAPSANLVLCIETAFAAVLAAAGRFIDVRRIADVGRRCCRPGRHDTEGNIPRTNLYRGDKKRHHGFFGNSFRGTSGRQSAFRAACLMIFECLISPCSFVI
jgi:hypothetical protein